MASLFVGAAVAALCFFLFHFKNKFFKRKKQCAAEALANKKCDKNKLPKRWIAKGKKDRKSLVKFL